MPRKKKEEKINFEQFVSERSVVDLSEYEKSVLGAILMEQDCLMAVRKIIKTSDIFSLEANQIIYDAICELSDAANPIDILTVSDILRKKDLLDSVGGAYYVTMLTMSVVSAANVSYHAMLVFQQYIRRNLQNYAMTLYGLASDQTEDELQTFNNAIIRLDEIKAKIVSLKEIDFKEQVEIAVNEIVDAGNGKVNAISTGFKNVDEITGGRVNGESTIIAARTSMGKTTRMIKEIMNITIVELKKVGVISLETKAGTLIKKMLSNLSRIDSTILRKGNLSLGELDRVYDAKYILQKHNIFIHDLGNVNISDVKALAARWKAQFDIDILYIDYLTIIKHQNPYTKTTNDEITKISQGIKQITMDLNIPVVTLAQINRDPEKRGNKRPNMSDLRDSGSIEQDADVISLLYRPEYYGEMFDQDGFSLEGVMEESIKKNRNGSIGDVYHRFHPAISEFEPLNNKPNFGKQSTSFQGNGVQQFPWKDENENPPF